MPGKVLMTLLLLFAVPVCAQTDSQPDYGGDATSGSVMIAPPPVSGQAYPTEVGSEMRTNYMEGAVTFGGGYLRNLYVGGETGIANETSFTIQPNISIDEATPRQHLRLKYWPEFNFYEPTNSLNETDQSLQATYLLHVAPHVILSAGNFFQKAAVIYTSPILGEGVSSSPPVSATGPIPPLTHRTSDTAQGTVSWQYARYAMVGGSGTYARMRFSNASQTTGLFNSDSRGVSGFWSRRVSESQDFGAVYQYFDILADPSQPLSETQTHTIYAFYTQYLTDRFSVSVSAGPQYFQIDQPSEQTVQSWSPAVIASLGCQGPHTSLSLSYDWTVTGGGGLLGAYHTQTASASGRWQMAKSWTAALSGGYANNKGVSSNTSATSPFLNTSGHMISGDLAIDHSLTEHITMAGEYERIHQSYGSIAAIAVAPNSDRIMMSLSWRFNRLLGR